MSGRGLRLTGWGVALPDKTVTNADLEVRLDTTVEWITERTGIRERRVGDSTAGLAVAAGRQALERAGVTAADVDLVLLATCTTDQALPATSAHVQAELGVPGGAFDLNAACSGFVYGLVTARGLLATGADRILLIGSETLSRIVDWDDRNTACSSATPPARSWSRPRRGPTSCWAGTWEPTATPVTCSTPIWATR
jgi:3-oxoacyl-[acyl-carrier-protein] synthase-3